MPSDIRNDTEMASFVIKGDEKQWTEALKNRNSAPEEGGIVQIKINGNTTHSKRRPDKSDFDEEAANKKRRKAKKVKNDKKSKRAGGRPIGK